MGHTRISASVLLEATIDEHGKWKFTQRMRDRIYENEEEFRSRVILKINEVVGEEWHVHFIETPSKDFMADIHVNDGNHFAIMVGILKAYLNDKIESCWHKRFPREE